MIDDVVAQPLPRKSRILGVASTTLVIAIPAIASLWLIAPPGQVQSNPNPDEAARVMRYSTVQTMAEHLGCSANLRPAEQQGGSSSSGECIYDGASVELRIYPSPQQTAAWLDGARRPGQLHPGIYGGKWAAVIHTTDRDLANRAFIALQN